MKRIILVLLLLIVATPALAVAKKCPPKCAHRAKSAACVQLAAPALWGALVEGLTLNAGFRWQTERECPTLALPNPPLEAHDPFYLGAQVNLPLAPRVGLFGAFERDWTDEARWTVRTGLAFKPFGGTP